MEPTCRQGTTRPMRLTALQLLTQTAQSGGREGQKETKKEGERVGWMDRIL